MNKRELVAQITKDIGLTQAEVARAVNAIVETIQENLQAGGEVVMVGFGIFSVADRAARVGRNPATGEAIKISSSRVVKFRPGTALKEVVNVKSQKMAQEKK